jgi:hypothetical protein
MFVYHLSPWEFQKAQQLAHQSWKTVDLHLLSINPVHKLPMKTTIIATRRAGEQTKRRHGRAFKPFQK